MSIKFQTTGIWRSLTKAAKSAKCPAFVAVAYFGQGASKLLPLPKGSHLVVDASPAAVKAGQTHPGDLATLLHKGVNVFSVPNLHAKVFVLGSEVFVGSANVSRHSAGSLIEGQIRTTAPKVVAEAKKFILQHSIHQLTPTSLKQLAKLYRPPRLPGGKRGPSDLLHDPQPEFPTIYLAQLEHIQLEDEDQELHDRAWRIARKRQRHPRQYVLESFYCDHRVPYEPGEILVQVTAEGTGKHLISSPATVRYVRNFKTKRGHRSFIYLEHPPRKRRALESVARELGNDALEKLKIDGQVRDQVFARDLLNLWALTREEYE